MTRRVVDAARIMDMVTSAMVAEKISGEVTVRSGSLTGTRWVGLPSKNDVRLEIDLTKIPHDDRRTAA